MSKSIENLVKSFMSGVDSGEVSTFEKESHRIYLSTRLQGYDDRFKILQMAVNATIEVGDHNQSPFMLGYVEGMRRALAFILDYKVEPLKKPTVWYNDPAFEQRLKWIGANRIRVRRHVAKLAWSMLCIFYKYNQKGLDIQVSFLERRVRDIVKGIMKDFPTVSQIRAERKRLIKLTGANYEEVTSTKTVESWWG